MSSPRPNCNIYIYICKNIKNNLCKLFEFRAWIPGGRDHDFGILHTGPFILIIHMVHYTCSERMNSSTCIQWVYVLLQCDVKFPLIIK